MRRFFPLVSQYFFCDCFLYSVGETPKNERNFLLKYSTSEKPRRSATSPQVRSMERSRLPAFCILAAL